MTYATSRFYFLNYGCCCNFFCFNGDDGCCPGKYCKKKGAIDEFKEEILLDMYKGEKTKFTFTKYCMGDKELNSYGANENLKKLENKVYNQKKGFAASLCGKGPETDKDQCNIFP